MVIAINRDPIAPIFDRADIAIVADASRILTRILNELPICLKTAGDDTVWQLRRWVLARLMEYACEHPLPGVTTPCLIN